MDSQAFCKFIFYEYRKKIYKNLYNMNYEDFWRTDKIDIKGIGKNAKRVSKRFKRATDYFMRVVKRP